MADIDASSHIFCIFTGYYSYKVIIIYVHAFYFIFTIIYFNNILSFVVYNNNEDYFYNSIIINLGFITNYNNEKKKFIITYLHFIYKKFPNKLKLLVQILIFLLICSFFYFFGNFLLTKQFFYLMLLLSNLNLIFSFINILLMFEVYDLANEYINTCPYY